MDYPNENIKSGEDGENENGRGLPQKEALAALI